MADEKDDEAKAAEKSEPDKKSKSEAKADDKASSPWPSARKSTTPAPPEVAEKKAAPPAPVDEEWPKQSWGAPLARIDQRWTAIEARLVWWVLAAEFGALCFTVLIAGLATDPGGGAVSGIVLRSVLGATVLGLVTRRALKKHPYMQWFVTGAVAVGLILGPQWANAGVQYFGNFRNWLQNASSLMLVGGVGQLAKRLTLWLALLGASVATAQGKHINVDVVMRFLKPRQRVPVAVIGWLAAALVCFGGVRAFFDELAIADYRAKDEKPCVEDKLKTCDTSESERAGEVFAVVRRDFFILGRQISLDFKAIPKIVSGVRYDEWLGAEEWNAWMKDGGWETYYPKADVDSLLLPPGSSEKRSPAVIIPGAAENPQELMIRELDLIVPFGLFMIALRFLLRVILALAGWVKVDPNAAHADDLGPNEGDREEKEAKEEEDVKAKAGGAA